MTLCSNFTVVVAVVVDERVVLCGTGRLVIYEFSRSSMVLVLVAR